MLKSNCAALAFLLAFPASSLAADGAMHGMEMPMGSPQKPAPVERKPADGASVRIISPKNGEIVRGDSVPLEFQLTKGKQGNHVHAYVDGQLMGMFSGEKGTLTGIKPGKHSLELRVVGMEHTAELDASDRVDFVTR